MLDANKNSEKKAFNCKLQQQILKSQLGSRQLPPQDRNMPYKVKHGTNNKTEHNQTAAFQQMKVIFGLLYKYKIQQTTAG
jgi:hypothetical protein